MENLKNLRLDSDLTQLKSCLTSGSIFFAWDSVNTWKNRSKLSPSSSLSTRPKTGQLKMSKLSSFCQVLSQRNCAIASVTRVPPKKLRSLSPTLPSTHKCILHISLVCFFEYINKRKDYTNLGKEKCMTSPSPTLLYSVVEVYLLFFFFQFEGLWASEARRRVGGRD